MSRAKVADSSGADFTCVDSILESLPARESRFLSSAGAVQKEKIDVSQTRSLYRLLHRSPHHIVRLIAAGKLGSVPDIFTLQTELVLATSEEVTDSLTGLALVPVHLRTVKGAVTSEKALADCIGGFPSRHHVEAELYPGDDEAIVELHCISWDTLGQSPFEFE